MMNQDAAELFDHTCLYAANFAMELHEVGDAKVLDAAANGSGSLDGGLILARLCMGDQADISLHPMDADTYASASGVYVRTDAPVQACLGAQYAGWPVQTEDFFAMGSGPMRMIRGREDVLKDLQLAEQGEAVVGVLESDRMPSAKVIGLIADECGVPPNGVRLAVAPSFSLSGSVQVVARSIETALHKLHELKFNVSTVLSATGIAPLPPPAKRGDTIGGIGRTNDAMLYGAHVTLWVDTDDDAIEQVAARVPSESSPDHGQPFAKIFARYHHDFYKVDPMLFSPARVTFHNVRTGRTQQAGAIKSDVLQESFHG